MKSKKVILIIMFIFVFNGLHINKNIYANEKIGKRTKSYYEKIANCILNKCTLEMEPIYENDNYLVKDIKIEAFDINKFKGKFLFTSKHSLIEIPYIISKSNKNMDTINNLIFDRERIYKDCPECNIINQQVLTYIFRNLETFKDGKNIINNSETKRKFEKILFNLVENENKLFIKLIDSLKIYSDPQFTETRVKSFLPNYISFIEINFTVGAGANFFERCLTINVEEERYIKLEEVVNIENFKSYLKGDIDYALYNSSYDGELILGYYKSDGSDIEDYFFEYFDNGHKYFAVDENYLYLRFAPYRHTNHYRILMIEHCDLDESIKHNDEFWGNF